MDINNNNENLKKHIDSVLKKRINQKSEDNKNISKFVESENNKIEKKCKTCNESITKLTPYLVVSGIIFIFFIYGVISLMSNIFGLFSQ